MKKVCMQTGQQIGKAASKTLRKRCSMPLWLLLVLICVPAFCNKFPGPQQPITEPVAGLAPAPLEAATSPGPIAGIDVSMWQGSIDWETVKESGVEFVIIKATEGTNYVDPFFVTH